MNKFPLKPIVGLALALSASNLHAQVFGSLANFDVVNDTGKTAHGFEIDIHDIHAKDISSLFGAANRWPNMERYGAPTVTEFTDATGFGVKIIYQATNNGSWSSGTPSGTLPVSPSDSCWPLGAPNYGPLYPCDHFGVSTNVNTPNVAYSWLVENAANPNGPLVPVQASVPNPQWVVTPQPPINNVPQAPKVNVAIAAPKPLGYEFGEPRWVKVTATGTLQNVAVEDLVAENAVIKKARTQTQLEWQLLQVDSGSPGSGQIDLTGVALDPGAKGVVYRFEFYQYTGQRDPATNEALVGLNGDTPGANGPSKGDLGKFIVAQNAGINFDGVIPAAPPLPIAPSINATISGATANMPYSQVISATPGVANDTLNISVTGLPAGLTFNAVNNTIVGTPTVVGTFPLTIIAQDASNFTSTTATTQINIADAPIVFNLSLAPGMVGTPYSQALSVTGGYGAIAFSSFGALPSGLSLVGNTISGTPTVAGSTLIQLTATDSLGYSQNASQTLTVAAAGAGGGAACSGTNKVISNASKFWMDIAGGLANGGQSVVYAPQAKTTFVPSTLAANGIKFGEIVSYTGTSDNAGFCNASSMTIAAGLSLTPVTLPNAQVGSPITSTAITPAGGIAPYTVSVSGLPSGLSFDGKNIIGTPALGTNGVQTVSVSINDSIGETINTTLSMTIAAAPVVVPTANLPVGMVGSAYSGTVSATGGVGKLTLSVTGLPKGLSYAAGNVAGKPTVAGASTVAITAKDSIGQSVTSTSVLTINPIPLPPIVLGSSTIPSTAKIATAYAGTAAATGGVGALKWKATGLPTGLKISTAGAISGKPTKVGTYNAVFTVTDTKKQTATINVTITVAK